MGSGDSQIIAPLNVMFKKDFKNVKIKFGSRGILGEAMAIFERLFFYPHIDKEIKDKHGIIGLDIGNFFLVAKKEPYGDVVSVSKKVWDLALKKKKKVIMYIQLSGYFYRFDPAEIDKYEINERGGSEMVNFDIRWGTNLMKLMARKRKIDFIVLKNEAMKIKEEEKIKEFSKSCL